jgi:hypothetical protein
MTDREGTASGSIGRLSYKPPERDRLVPRTLEFIFALLPNWRDDPRRPAGLSEKALNSTLCDFLDTHSRSNFPMVRFKHETPQQGAHMVDLGVHGTDEVTTVGTREYSIYQPFLAIEAKRLPAPSQDREREYVTGTEKPTGGIQRFKLGLHGANVETGVIVGYVEKETARHWHTTINSWISSLSSTETRDDTDWSDSEVLSDLRPNEDMGTSWSESIHGRASACCTKSITLHHLWVMMDRNPEETK